MSVSIRSRLLLLVLSVLLPTLAGLAYFVVNTYAAEREAHTRTLRDTARALAQVVDGELRRRAAVADTLAGSRWLDTGANASADDLRRFERLAQRSLQELDGWIEVRSTSGVLLDTRRGPLSPAADAGFELTGRPVVEPLQLGAAPDQAYAAVVEPVQRDGRTLLNLALTIRPVELQRIIDRQQMPAGWFATILDSSARVVARRPHVEALVGREASADIREHMATRSDELFRSVSLDGKPTVGYIARTSQGWAFAIAMPPEQFSGLLPRSVLQLVLGALVLVGLAVAAAIWVARRIEQPVHMLKAAAAQVHAGEPVSYRRTGIVECDEVASALARAAELIQRGRIDLEQQVELAVERTRIAEQRASHGQRIEALGRLTGGVAHDFNNLLGVISNSAHLIERHAAAKELQLPLSGIQRAVAVGSQVTQHLLRFAGRRPVQPTPIELARYLPEVQELMRSVLGPRISMTVRVAADTAPVRVDSGELELALINLALNARDAMPAGGELRLGARNATADETEGLPGHAQRRYVLITVGDDGNGIEATVAARVFEPFFTTKQVGKGTGLGLSQVLGFCVQAGGTARLASTPGVGTTVSLLLPAAAPGSTPPEAAPDAQASALTALHGTRLLLVEDNEELARTTAALLQMQGIEVCCAGSAAQALQHLTPPHDVDIVLSDVIMPGDIDGLMLARRLQQEQPDLPVVLISGYSDAAMRAADLKVLRKPFSAEQLLQALAKALAARPRAGADAPRCGA